MDHAQTTLTISSSIERFRHAEPPHEGERKAAKAEYDQEYRAANLGRIREGKRVHHAANAKAIYAAQRAKLLADPGRMQRYRDSQRRCQSTPEWKARKRGYDREFRAKKDYGEFWESQVALYPGRTRAPEPVGVRLVWGDGAIDRADGRGL